MQILLVFCLFLCCHDPTDDAHAEHSETRRFWKLLACAVRENVAMVCGGVFKEISILQRYLCINESFRWLWPTDTIYFQFQWLSYTNTHTRAAVGRGQVCAVSTQNPTKQLKFTFIWCSITRRKWNYSTQSFRIRNRCFCITHADVTSNS